MIKDLLLAEKQRLKDSEENRTPWKKWGPYLSERQWGTVREDYSHNGDAWNYFTHDHSRSRAYRWGEDGLAGISDDRQILCFAVALWNGQDSILKERLFGLNNNEGNHGEDVKEYYFYLDNTPTHSYMKYLYKYPQSAFPYEDLVATNRQRSKDETEYELLDTGVFETDRYFDVFVEYAKKSPEDILIRICVANRGPERASIHVLPTLWFRNTWSWGGNAKKPILKKENEFSINAIHALHTDPNLHAKLGDYYLYCDRDTPLLFTENETNEARLSGGQNASAFTKDGFHDFLIHDLKNAVNTGNVGTKAAPHYQLHIDSGDSQEICLRLTRNAPAKDFHPFADFVTEFCMRIREADEFYGAILPAEIQESDPERTLIMRQALAGMLWTKQYFCYDVNKWLEEHGVQADTNPAERKKRRNGEWSHAYCDGIISMPDKWEYPWFAAWDLAFHTLPLAIVDPTFAKSQLEIMLRNEYLHPNGQIPAYEWNFGDVNPPVHAYATLQIYLMDKEQNQGQGDISFLKYAFTKLLLNFTWWVNRKDRDGNDVFQGGFLGLDNIGVFDRSSPLPTGGYLEQADGTAWMVLFSQQMLQIAIELASQDSQYEEFVSKFLEHTVRIGAAMDRIGDGHDSMWDEDDGFFYDVLRFPDGSATRLKVRSIVGLLPLASVAIFEAADSTKLVDVQHRTEAFFRRHPELLTKTHLPTESGINGRRMLSLFTEAKLRRVLTRMLDEKEFLSPYGIRALSRYHQDHPFLFQVNGEEYRVDYLPAESNNGMFGGNSNWRGPVWMPINYVLLTSLYRLYSYYGDDFKIECPTGSGIQKTLFEVAQDLGERLTRIFLPNELGQRPVFGAAKSFQLSPHWKDYLLFYEYFHGDNGAGIGASHQTGWTGCIARVLQLQCSVTKKYLLRE